MDTSLKKAYYSISEVANILDLSPSLIRFWEKEFPQVSPRKTRKGNRMFSAEDIETLDIIKQLVKKQGYTLEGAKQSLQKNRKALQEQRKHLQELKEIRDFLCRLRDALQ